MHTFVTLLLACGASAEPAPAPAPVPAAPAPVAAPPLKWELIALPPKLTMAERASFRLRRQVTNTGDAPADATAAYASFTLNGERSMGLDLAFGNGGRESRWSALPPGEKASDDRAMGDLFEAPGDYTITMTTGDQTSTVTVHVSP